MNPDAAACLTALIWFKTGGYLLPFAAGYALAWLGFLATGFASRRAWSFIPRRRQDLHRSLPLRWRLASSLLLAGMLGLALGLIIVGLARLDPADWIRGVLLGAFLIAAMAGNTVPVIRAHGDAMAGLPRPPARQKRLRPV